jgi:hypoxanthine phosphoribosyltransferase
MSKSGNAKVRELISEAQLRARVSELGKEIANQYKNEKEPLVLIGVLKGSIIFLADLCRAIDLPLEIEMMGVSSYGEDTKSSGVVRITQDLTRPIANKHVVIVEDILDTGLTLKYLSENLWARGPKSLKVCSLLKKDVTPAVKVAVDFLGFNIPNEFVVGYGLDVAERMRNLPMLAVYEGTDPH